MVINNKGRIAFFLCLTVLGIAGAMFARQIGQQQNNKVQEEIPQKLTEADVAELSGVFRKIDTANNLLLEGTYELYDIATDSLLETEPFILAKYHGETYSLVGPIEQFVKGNKYVMVDNSLQAVLGKDSLENDTSFAILKGFSEINQVIDEGAGVKVSFKDIRGNRSVKIEGDSLGTYKTSEIIFDRTTRKLKMASIVTNVTVPGNEENIEKKLLLKLVLKKYEEAPSGNEHIHLNGKLSWKGKQIQLPDSLKKYQVTYY